MNIPDIITGLSTEERAELFNLLKVEFQSIPKLAEFKAELNSEQAVYCPHCKSIEIYGHGTYKGRKRYKCKACNKTFNDFTGTAISGIKKSDKFQEYLELVVERVSIRKAANKLGLSIQTIFDWRHKLLSSLPKTSGDGFTGIVECDDKQLNINEKGSRNLGREAYKRTSDRTTKRGVSNDKVSIMVASDRKGNTTMQIAKIGRIDKDSIERTVGDLITKENTLCSDSHPSIITWAKDKEIEHHTFVASKHHVKSKCYHVQHVNSLDNRYERWTKGFYGTSTKYLANYLNWFVFLEKIKKSLNPIGDLAKVVVGNTNTMDRFKSAEINFANLINLHYS